MSSTPQTKRTSMDSWPDEQVVAEVRAGNTALYEILMRRYNQRLYRVVRSILHDDSETEEILQDAYVNAYIHLEQFEGRASFATWLTRIAVHAALACVRRRNRSASLDEMDLEGEPHMNLPDTSPGPEQTTSSAELRELLEKAVMALPEAYRTVLMLRDIEELSTSETAAALDLTEENVKVRLHRGRALMRRDLFARVGATAKEAFPFMGIRCDRVVAGVFEKLKNLPQ
ncbi:MAG: RNA polymerase sigma factor [Acidobacteriia bacterium]|nr:RNA polymerase sigma factor [Terriglobia bacterium]